MSSVLGSRLDFNYVGSIVVVDESLYLTFNFKVWKWTI
jgi:hypothetical protein